MAAGSLAFRLVLPALCASCLAIGAQCGTECTLEVPEPLEEEAELLEVRLLQTSIALNSKAAATVVQNEASVQLPMQTLQEEPSSRKSLAMQAQEAIMVRSEWVVLGVYAVIYLVSVSLIIRSMTRSTPSMDTKLSSGKAEDMDAETRVWKQGFLSWLAVSWATPWCARWGHSLNSAMTKIKAEQLPQLGFHNDLSQASADEFEKLWAEELEAKGEEKASVASVLMRMVPKNKLITGGLAYSWAVLIGQLYSVYLVRFSLMHFFKLQAWVLAHPHEERNLTNQLLIAIFAFTIYPISQIIILSITNSITTQLDQRMCGGLAVALFRKAQRLPSTGGTEQSSPKEGTGAKADLQTLLNHDILTALIGSFDSLCLAGTAAMSVFVLFFLMASQLRLATICAFGIAIPCVSYAVVLGGGIGEVMLMLQERTDKRVVTLREVLFGVRVVKCYGWEVAMEQKLAALRNKEVEGLRSYWHYTCGITALLVAFPRLLIWAGLVGYAAIYGAHDVATIFTSLQILACLRGSCEILATSLARCAGISPSVSRIQAFLKLPEAPPVCQNGQLPAWLHHWTPTGGRDESLKIQGTFSWSSDPSVAPAIRSLNLEIPRGELLAIVGGVGSGKSALLQAILGELMPDETEVKAFISRPKVIAYCSQVPYIAEGTLKENVLFGQSFEQLRYEEALQAASLGEDLNVLPGGDQVPIGARGISLSGGQKARVSMARAAYHLNSQLVLMDDPFASVDAPTAKVIMEKLLLGRLMEGRTCVVATQPDVERLSKFHSVVLMAEGKVVLQGDPETVMASEAFQMLLSSREGESFTAQEDAEPKVKRKASKSREQAESLREEEFEGRPSIALVKDYAQIGRYRHLFSACLLLAVMVYVFLLCDLVIAHWSNELALNPTASSRPYLTAYMFWLLLSLVFFVFGWHQGQTFTMRLSAAIHNRVIHKLLRAPIDRFFDKQPVGRIMSRLVGDLASVDLSLYAKTLQTVTTILATITPLLYVHTMVPMLISVMALPLYYVIFAIYTRYRNTSVPMRYCFASTKSDMNGLLTDVMSSTAAIRAYGDEERLSKEMCMQMDKTLKVCMMSHNVLRRWLGNRVQYLWGFLTSTTYVAGLLYPDKVGAGTLGVCITNLLMMQNLIESNIDSAIGSLFEIIALARIHEYVDVPQERCLTSNTDAAYRSFTVRVPRSALGVLKWWRHGEIVQVFRGGKLLLQSSADNKALLPAAAFEKEGSQLHDLCLQNARLREAHAWHRLIGVSDVVGDAEQMARELCGEGARSPDVVLDVRSGWVADGAKVELENVKAGYADIPRDVLKGINLVFQPKTKVGIVGTTGCGKSSLLLVLLRILEPRAGRVLINNVDTQKLGLMTLRGALGLVPQDPILFTGSLRHNLDPLEYYTDGRIWEALRCAHLDGLVRSFVGGLDYQVSDEGSNLSFGQRQLFCLARMVLRQPSLLLLDEATSAIDPRTQENVQETISHAFPDSTLVAIAHRLETVLEFDQVVVLDSGEVEEQGTPKELQQLQDGQFRRMLAAKKVW